MTLKVLKKQSQIGEARAELRQRGLSTLDSALTALLRRLRISRSLAVGDRVKSWDVLLTLRFLEQHVANDQPILDIGCYASELLVALHRDGYTKLFGADFDPNLKQMPHPDEIHYSVCNFMKTAYAAQSFAAITAVSVIEHGFDAPALLREVSRLLRPDGHFIASFDYWPSKIDTSDKNLFGVSWTIFSQEEIAAFVAQAADYGLYPIGGMDYAAEDPAIDFEGRRYTFGWMALQKRPA